MNTDYALNLSSFYVQNDLTLSIFIANISFLLYELE